MTIATTRTARNDPVPSMRRTGDRFVVVAAHITSEYPTPRPRKVRMYAAVSSSTLVGITGRPITVEVHVGQGLPGFTVVGQPDEGCREARDRVRAAMLSSGLEWPNRRVTVNVATGERRTDKGGGASLDLAIAVGLLVSTETIEARQIENLAFLAELGLDGSLRAVRGAAPLAAAITDKEVVVAPASAGAASLGANVVVRAVSCLAELVAVLRGGHRWPDHRAPERCAAGDRCADLADVRGQQFARAALEVAAAGAHHMVMVGPPGAGKSMLASRLPGILPPLDDAAAFECAMVRSAAGEDVEGLARTAPYRAPHHSVSLAGMVGGGGGRVHPGEVSLASHGVLFLDEMGEFAPSVLDALRQPLEEGVVRVSRSGIAVEMPARFLLVAATNPCPCGRSEPGACRCTPSARQRYLRRFSGPLLDRFDVRVVLGRTAGEHLTSLEAGESSATVADRVQRAREIARGRQGTPNGAVPAWMIDDVAPLDAGALARMRVLLDSGSLSGRGFHRVRRVARTVADLAGHEGPLGVEHVETAVALRADFMPGLDPR